MKHTQGKWHFHTHPGMETDKGLPFDHVIIDINAYKMVEQLKENHAELLEVCKRADKFIESIREQIKPKGLELITLEYLKQAIESAES